MENIEFSPIQLSLAGEISVSQKNNILTDRIILQISGRKQISAQTVINGTTVHNSSLLFFCVLSTYPKRPFRTEKPSIFNFRYVKEV